MLAEAWRWDVRAIRALPVSRRKRAIRWLRELSRDRKATANGGQSTFNAQEVTDFVWHADLGEGFGDT